MRKAVILFTLATLGGCGGSLQKVHKSAYIGGAVTKSVVEETHKLWSEQLNGRADDCESSSESRAEFDECLGPFAHNDDVVIALAFYNKVAELLFRVLADPDATKEQILDVAARVIEAAEALFALMPNSGAPEKIKSILGK